VLVLVATGTYQSWRQVGSLDALVGTTFGRLVLVKIAGVVALVVLGNQARRWVNRCYLPPHRGLLRPVLVAHAASGTPTVDTGPTESGPPESGPPDRGAVATLRRGVLAETAVGLGVLAVTAVLVATVPARQDYVAPFEQTISASGLSVDVRVATPRAGDSALRLTARTPDGVPLPVTALSGTLSLPSAALGPLPIEQPAADPRHPGPVEATLRFPEPGEWTLHLVVTTSPTDATSADVVVPVS
jgi:copper transport protein